MKFFSKVKTGFKGIKPKEFVFAGIFALAVVFNYFFFGQMSIMINNPAEFNMVASEVVGIFIGWAVLILAVVYALMIFVRSLSKKVFIWGVAILSGMMLGGYFQLLFLNDESVMNLNGNPQLATAWQIISNSLIFLIFVAIPIVLLKLEKKKGKTFTPKLALAFCMILFGMQFVGLVTAAASADKPSKANNLFYFSIDEQFQLSQKDNIIVFILDVLDTEVIDEIDAVAPTDVGDTFKGFTYYDNNMAEYPGTFPSIVSFLTNFTFDKSIGKEAGGYMQEAWENQKLLSALKEKGYIVNGLIDSMATFYDVEDLRDPNNPDEYLFNNIETLDPKNRSIRGGELFGAISTLALKRQSPYAMKPIFHNIKYLDIPTYCIKVENTPGYYPRTISAAADLRFYEKLTDYKEGTDLALSAPYEDNGVFSFVHLHAQHSPYMYNYELERSEHLINKPSYGISQCRGTLKILREYFRQMQDLGIYDDATIYVMGDHGYRINTTNIVDPPTTALFIKESAKKDSGATKDRALIRDTVRPELSHKNFASTVLDVIGYDRSELDLPPSYYEVMNGSDPLIQEKYKDYYQDRNGDPLLTGDGKQTRIFYYVRWVNLSMCQYISTYEIKAPYGEVAYGNDLKYWTKID